MRLRSGRRTSPPKNAKGRKRREIAKKPVTAQTNSLPVPSLAISASRPIRKHLETTSGRKTKLGDLPTDVLAIILGAPLGKVLKRRDITNASQIMNGLSAFPALSREFLDVYKHYQEIDADVNFFIERVRIPTELPPFQRQIISIVDSIGPKLESLKIGYFNLHESNILFRLLATKCPNIHTLSFSCSMSSNINFSQRFLDSFPKLVCLEVANPTKEFLFGFSRSQVRVKKLSLIRMQQSTAAHLQSVLEIKGNDVQHLSLGELWTVWTVLTPVCELKKFFLANRTRLLDFLPNLRRLTILTKETYSGGFTMLGIDPEYLLKLRRAMSVEYRSDHTHQVFPKIHTREPPALAWDRCFSLEFAIRQMLRVPRAQVVEYYKKIKLPEVMKVFAPDLYSRLITDRDFHESFHEVCKAVSSSVDTLVFHGNFPSSASCLRACTVLSVLKAHLRKINKLYVSYEFIAYSDEHLDDVALVWRLFRDIKELHIRCQQSDYRGTPRAGFSRFMKNIPSFLSMLETSCRQIQLITLEHTTDSIFADHEIAYDYCDHCVHGNMETLKKGMERLAQFETKLPDVDVSLLRMHIAEWISQCPGVPRASHNAEEFERVIED